MARSFYISVCWVFLQAAICAAHPPSGIDVQYDASRGKLMLDVKHLSRDNVGHYIQRIEIQKNDERPRSFSYRQQVHPNSFTADITYSVETFDKLKITAYSREGGSKTVEWEATEEEMAREVEPRAKRQRSISTHPKDSDRLKPAVPTDPEISKPAVPKDSDKIRPAFTRDPDIAKPAIPTDPSKIRPAVSYDPDVAKPTHPRDPSKLKPAVPRTNSYSN